MTRREMSQSVIQLTDAPSIQKLDSKIMFFFVFYKENAKLKDEYDSRYLSP